MNPKSKIQNPKSLRHQLSRWYRTNARELPWRRTRDPYAIMVSEFMLQQTTVAAVVPYFERWMKRFPTIKALAQADEQAVLTLWQGLGYYSRACNLHRAAQILDKLPSGTFPDDPDFLRTLPGVGEYTAGAIAAFAFDQSVPVVDANIARVLARLNNWQHPVDDVAGRRFLRESAENLLPAKGGRLHTSALMELGALVCTPQKPACRRCPAQSSCLAINPEALPIKKERAITLKVAERRAFVSGSGMIWLEVSTGPRWRGLWLLPKVTTAEKQPVYVEIYPITRYQVTMQVVAEPRRSRKGLQGFSTGDLPPMPSPHRRAVAALLTKVHSAA